MICGLFSGQYSLLHARKQGISGQTSIDLSILFEVSVKIKEDRSVSVLIVTIVNVQVILSESFS
jgi:hypothetical protein